MNQVLMLDAAGRPAVPLTVREAAWGRKARSV